MPGTRHGYRRTLVLTALTCERVHNRRGVMLFVENLVEPPKTEKSVMRATHLLALAPVIPPPGLGSWHASGCHATGGCSEATHQGAELWQPAEQAQQLDGQTKPDAAGLKTQSYIPEEGGRGLDKQPARPSTEEGERAEKAAEGLATGAGDLPVSWKAPSSAAVSCLAQWVTLLRSAEGPFARFARGVVENTIEIQHGCHRDPLPLSVPLMTDVVFPAGLSDDDCGTFLDFLRVTVAGLKWMFAGARRCRCPAVSTVGHKRVFASLLARILVMAASLDEGAPVLDCERGVDNLLGNQSIDMFPELRADAVDIFRKLLRSLP